MNLTIMKNLILIRDTVNELQSFELVKDLNINNLSREAFLLLTELYNNKCHPEVYNAVIKQLSHIRENLPNKEEVKHSLNLMESWIEVLIRTKEAEDEIEK